MKYTTIFLDFDDTLIDTEGNTKKCMQEIYKDHNIAQYYPTFDEFFEIYHTSTSELWKNYAKGIIDKATLQKTRFKVPFQKFENIEQSYLENMSTDFLGRMVLMNTHIEGAKELLSYLKSKYKVAMISNGFSEMQYKKIESAGMTKYFDEIILSDAVGINKPHPDIFTFALNKLEATADKSIMIGDNILADIEGAMNSNIDQIWYNPNRRDSELNPTHVVKHLSEIMDIL